MQTITEPADARPEPPLNKTDEIQAGLCDGCGNPSDYLLVIDDSQQPRVRLCRACLEHQ